MKGYPRIKFATTEGTATTFYPYYSQSGSGASCVFHFGNMSGNSNSCNSTVTVQDTTAPVISSVTPSPNLLWPPDHKMVAVAIAISATDTCDPNPVCKVITIASSEPPLGGGSGNTSPDFAITGPKSVNLRAERDGTGSGRTYTITVQCTDASNNSSQANTTVSVPHSR